MRLLQWGERRPALLLTMTGASTSAKPTRHHQDWAEKIVVRRQSSCLEEVTPKTSWLSSGFCVDPIRKRSKEVCMSFCETSSRLMHDGRGLTGLAYTVHCPPRFARRPGGRCQLELFRLSVNDARRMGPCSELAANYLLWGLWPWQHKRKSYF